MTSAIGLGITPDVATDTTREAAHIQVEAPPASMTRLGDNQLQPRAPTDPMAVATLVTTTTNQERGVDGVISGHP